MKTLFTLVALGTMMLLGIPITKNGNAQQLEMQLLDEEVFRNKVKIFDFEGNLLKELTVDEVAQNEISVADYMILESSDYAFTYLGDYYYLKN